MFGSDSTLLECQCEHESTTARLTEVFVSLSCSHTPLSPDSNRKSASIVFDSSDYLFMMFENTTVDF